jgi:hypothetical protein
MTHIVPEFDRAPDPIGTVTGIADAPRRPRLPRFAVAAFQLAADLAPLWLALALAWLEVRR